jgi:hypothetical protein
MFEVNFREHCTQLRYSIVIVNELYYQIFDNLMPTFIIEAVLYTNVHPTHQ